MYMSLLGLPEGALSEKEEMEMEKEEGSVVTSK
jgi:hypothetical protein